MTSPKPVIRRGVRIASRSWLPALCMLLLFFLATNLASANTTLTQLEKEARQGDVLSNITLIENGTDVGLSGESLEGQEEEQEEEQQEEREEEQEQEVEHGEEHNEPGHAVLFPAITLTFGVLVFYILTRYSEALPYTAIMFLIGALMGIGVELVDEATDHVSLSTRMWANIDSELLLLVFLPGLIFKDAMGLNVHLFQKAVVQCLIFAFPMVLLGTYLTACVAKYVFPYDWSWDLALTFGSILSATDPVAVAALLEAVGAPPRLKVHISGEALLNDGAAIVFFTIFSARYFFELGVDGFGEDIGWARGFAIFFRMSLGGMAIGFAFGLGILFILHNLDKRFNREENVVEVTATLAMAYLGYYVAEVVCLTSGVIATLAAGVTVKLFGRAMLNDAKLLDDFWILLEHILNTVLFTLGGAVWGSVIADGESHGEFVARDWGYLIVLYLFAFLIRGILFFLGYPITTRIGLKTNMKETFFQVYGGLRGAVGIALAISLDSAVEKEAADDSKFADDTNKALGMVGGMALLTLFINGSTAGPILVKMGLADSTETRRKIVKAYAAGFKQQLIGKLVELLTEERFCNINFGLVKAHVPYLADITKLDLQEAVEHHKDITASHEYVPPYLHGVLPYLPDPPPDSAASARSTRETLNDTKKERSDSVFLASLVADGQKAIKAKRNANRNLRKRRKSNIQYLMADEPLSATEMRVLFISLLRANYEQMINHGELVDREFLAVALEQSLEFASDSVANGNKLEDWQFVHVIDGPATGFLNRLKHHFAAVRIIDYFLGKGNNVKSSISSYEIERAMCFMAAHKRAQHYVEREFASAENELSEAVKVVIDESLRQWMEAKKALKSHKKADVARVTSHKFCAILLNAGAHYVTKLVDQGLLKDDEAEHWVREIEEHLEHLLSCELENHPGEMHLDVLDDEDTGVESGRDKDTAFELPESTK